MPRRHEILEKGKEICKAATFAYPWCYKTLFFIHSLLRKFEVCGPGPCVAWRRLDAPVSCDCFATGTSFPPRRPIGQSLLGELRRASGLQKVLKTKRAQAATPQHHNKLALISAVQVVAGKDSATTSYKKTSCCSRFAEGVLNQALKSACEQHTTAGTFQGCCQQPALRQPVWQLPRRP